MYHQFHFQGGWATNSSTVFASLLPCLPVSPNCSLPLSEVNPATLPKSQQPPRWPSSLSDAVTALKGDPVLAEALGAPLMRAIVAVREVRGTAL